MSDACFVINVESFYKSRLLKELALKGLQIEAIFLDRSEIGRDKDFFESQASYKATYLADGSTQLQLFQRILQLEKRMNRPGNEVLFLGGWDRWEYWLAAFFSGFRKRVLIVESTIFEHKKSHIKDFLKRTFLSRIDECIVCGEPHEALIRHLGFGRKCIVSGGVGLVDQFKRKRSVIERRPTKLVFLGRLSPEKNLFELISAAAIRPEFHLTIAGSGPLAEELRSRISQSKNITFEGYVPRVDVLKFLSDFDVLILPSTSETWGFVCDEAVSAGVPILVSNRVGCASFYIDKHECGLVFEPTAAGIVDALDKISETQRYASLLSAVTSFDILKKNQKYIAAFQDAIVIE